jgi:hypothetical protein
VTVRAAEDSVTRLRRAYGAAIDRPAGPEPHTNGASVVALPGAELFSRNGTAPGSLVDVRRFAGVREAGARPILGSPDDAVIGEGTDTLGFGGAGTTKTSLFTVDLALHLATGTDWLGFEVPRAVRVAVIEGEGSRPWFRRKWSNKLATWRGADPCDNLCVLEEPWGFDVGRDHHVADLLAELEVDVLIAGPVSAIGLRDNGTLPQARDFMAKVQRLRDGTGRPLATLLIHHDNRQGLVSGAFEGVVDTLLRTEVPRRGKTVLHFEKCRWAPSFHRQRLDLRWTEGEGFEVATGAGGDDRDLAANIVAWLREQPPSTAEQIAEGVQVRELDVRAAIESNPERFTLHTGEAAKALGRRSNAKLWEAVDDAG